MDKYSRLQWRLVALVLVMLVVVIWAIQNQAPVELFFLWPTPLQVPLALVIVVSIVAGMLLSFALSLWTQRRLRRQIRDLERQLLDQRGVEIEERPYAPEEEHHDESLVETMTSSSEAGTALLPSEEEGEALEPGAVSAPSDEEPKS